MTELTLAKALGSGLRRALSDDDKVVLLGEDIGTLGGVFRVTDGLQRDFGKDRVIDTPLAEAGIIGMAVGLAFRGYRPVCEIQFDGFIYPGFDQIVAQVAKLHYRTAGKVRMPLTIRVPYGGGIGAVEHHSESPEAYFAHTAGLRVVTCSTPQDAHSMLREAIASDDPVLFFEPKRRYWTKGEVDEDATALPMGKARVVTEGTDVTLVTYGPLVATALDAAVAAADDGISIEVVDLRSLSPVDFDTVSASVRKTGRLVITHEAAESGGIGAEIAATLTDRCFYYLEAAPVRITGFDVPYPAAKLEDHFLPDLDRILDGVDRALGRVNSLTGWSA
ncbi:pyruvate dehydrogenase E1 component beta subunit [Salinibacterium amurskyense]|uniref:Pyruvate dehydrogenase E1 component beta subunit n=1 Tax=Salinibacterium amurskyense TaxID=205941 RepID=A0A2M9D8J5_9MICO|nr:alpha-ketoacid dehydrogenase subunit beta [Salinibacterium amurskyense]PJJ82045.1 pyruvate dehydrogenase E1 component beta subunit [Salinibacterium amurskyense]RLQ81828.1 alpha-ketoacid dehydrogenase subunit beta [Salinibacterium amurskyense]GHD78369.1 pyruvate dehydrogenase E1 component beta subunit [Salinibacterium amurskyense]